MSNEFSYRSYVADSTFPYSSVRPVLQKTQFTSVSFMPFSIPIELERPEALDELNTYRVRSGRGRKPALSRHLVSALVSSHSPEKHVGCEHLSLVSQR